MTVSEKEPRRDMEKHGKRFNVQFVISSGANAWSRNLLLLVRATLLIR